MTIAQAESNPKEKDVTIDLVMNFLNIEYHFRKTTIDDFDFIFDLKNNQYGLMKNKQII